MSNIEPTGVEEPDPLSINSCRGCVYQGYWDDIRNQENSLNRLTDYGFSKKGVPGIKKALEAEIKTMKDELDGKCDENTAKLNTGCPNYQKSEEEIDYGRLDIIH